MTRKAANSAAISEKKKRKIPEALERNKFKPGQSGNPSGRPKKKPLTELYEQLLSDPKIMDQVRKSVVDMVKSGRMVGQLQLKEMAERVEGKVTQAVDVTGELTVKTLSERMQRARERASS